MASNTSTKIGHGLAKVLGIKLNYRNPTGDDLSRGESVFSNSTGDTYVEEEPRAIDWIRDVTPSGRDLLAWFYRLFPFVHWISRYNLQWFTGDMVAGTVPCYRPNSRAD